MRRRPNADLMSRTVVGGWTPAADPTMVAQLWQIKKQGSILHFEADVHRNGVTLNTLAAPTREELTQELERRYGRGR